MAIDIQVSVPSSGAGGGAASTEVLQLSPSVPSAATSSRLLSAQLLGDLATYTQLPALRYMRFFYRIVTQSAPAAVPSTTRQRAYRLPHLACARSNMLLLVPQPAGATPAQVLATNRSQWLLVDSGMVSLDGAACDKVGTSFTAFRYQVNVCGRAPQVRCRHGPPCPPHSAVGGRNPTGRRRVRRVGVPVQPDQGLDRGGQRSGGRRQGTPAHGHALHLRVQLHGARPQRPHTTSCAQPLRRSGCVSRCLGHASPRRWRALPLGQ